MRLDIARPSGSRTVGQPTTSTGNDRSAAMRRITASCCQSFSPKYAWHGPAMLKSLATTVATPAKCVGRDAPSIDADTSATDTDVSVGVPNGYISSTLGCSTTSTPAASHIAASRSKSRGYVARSSFAPNCNGFTKIVTRVTSRSATERSINVRWPSCR